MLDNSPVVFALNDAFHQDLVAILNEMLKIEAKAEAIVNPGGIDYTFTIEELINGINNSGEYAAPQAPVVEATDNLPPKTDDPAKKIDDPNPEKK
jgi:hypothetical protein